MTGALFRNVVYPGWHWAKRDGVNQALRELEQNQWLQTSELLDLQKRKLAALLSFASKNVPYYRTLLRDLEINAESAISDEDFRRIPPLTKEIIRHSQDALVSEDLAGNDLYKNSTSGSTGEAIHFFSDRRSMPYRKAAGKRSDSWTGWRLGDRVVRIWGAPLDRDRATSLRGKLHGWVTGDRLLSSFDLSDEKMKEYVNKIQNFKPQLILAYPGPLEQFALYCEAHGVVFPSLKAIVSSAETLWPHQREIIEGVFAVRVYNRYGAREVGQIGSECEAHDALHISADRLLVEIVDDRNQICAPTEEGRILITDLDNFGMPLIRYDIGDRGALSNKQSCHCGRGLPMLERIAGRTLEVVRTRNGRVIGGTFWTLLLRSRTGFKRFQVVQESLDGVTINYVRDATFDTPILDYFAGRIREYCGPDFNVKFVERKSIRSTKSGKQKLVVSRLDNQSENRESQER